MTGLEVALAGFLASLMMAATDEPRPGEGRNVPPAAVFEIQRRGTMVEHVRGTEGETDEALLAFVEAVAPPADDSHKWFFTLVVTRGCPWCDKMRADFASHPKLKAWVNVKDPKQSWAHWQVIQIEDQSQAWRWKNVKPTQFPTLIVQPPMNRSFGDPATIVYMHQGYIDPDKLDEELRAAIRAYTKKVAPQYQAWKREQSAEKALAKGGIGQPESATGQTESPWRPPATPPSPLPEPPVPFQVPPPAISPLSPSGPAADNLGLLIVALLGKVLPSFQTVLLLLLALSNVWMLYRDLARQSGVRLLIDDQVAQQIVTMIRKAAGGSGGQQPPSPPAA
jgi:hypothetical protein